MTATFLERFTGTAEPEGAPVSQPYARPSARPFWTGVPGLDPSAPPLADADLAARCAAMACALHVHGPDAGLRGIFGKPPAQKYLDWLLDASDDVEAWMRRYALRLACEHAHVIGERDILEVAGQVLAAVTPGRRR
jgi:hypothetical protein